MKKYILIPFFFISIFMVLFVNNLNHSSGNVIAESEAKKEYVNLSTDFEKYKTSDEIIINLNSSEDFNGTLKYTDNLNFSVDKSSKDNVFYNNDTKELKIKYANESNDSGIQLIFDNNKIQESDIYIISDTSEIISNKLHFNVINNNVENDDFEKESIIQRNLPNDDIYGNVTWTKRQKNDLVSFSYKDSKGLTKTNSTKYYEDDIFKNHIVINGYSVFNSTSAFRDTLTGNGIVNTPYKISNNGYTISDRYEGMYNGDKIVRTTSVIKNYIKYQNTTIMYKSGVVKIDIEMIYTGTKTLPATFSSIGHYLTYENKDSMIGKSLGYNKGVSFIPGTGTTRLNLIFDEINPPKSYFAGKIYPSLFEAEGPYEHLSNKNQYGSGTESKNYIREALIVDRNLLGIYINQHTPILDPINNKYKMSYKIFGGEPKAPKFNIFPPEDLNYHKEGIDINGEWSDEDGTNVSVFYKISSGEIIKVGDFYNENKNTFQGFSFNIPSEKLNVGKNDITIFIIDETGASVEKKVATTSVTKPVIEISKKIENLSKKNYFHVGNDIKFNIDIKNKGIGGTLKAGTSLEEIVPEGLLIDLNTVKLNNKFNSNVNYDASQRKLKYIFEKDMLYNDLHSLSYQAKIDYSYYKKDIIGTEVILNGLDSLNSNYFASISGENFEVTPEIPILFLDTNILVNGKNSKYIKPTEFLSHSIIIRKENLYSELSNIEININLSSGMNGIDTNSVKIDGEIIESSNISYDQEKNIVKVLLSQNLNSDSNEFTISYNPKVGLPHVPGEILNSDVTIKGNDSNGGIVTIGKIFEDITRIKGELTILNIEKELDFGVINLASSDNIVKSKNINFAIDLENTLQSDWSLKIKAEPLTSGIDKIENAFVYRDNYGKESILSSDSILIESSNDYVGNSYPDIKWDENKGVFLKIASGQAKAKKYNGNIIWELSNTPE